MYVLEQAELLHPDAANRLLKTIEEPPSSVVMILTTVDPEATLETIVSRCQHLRLGRCGGSGWPSTSSRRPGWRRSAPTCWPPSPRGASAGR